MLVGLLSFESLWWALLPPAIYLGIHLVEGETLTPMLLARRFTLNPVLIILSLVFWFWMWGVLGAILAVPMLAILKIICDRLRPLCQDRGEPKRSNHGQGERLQPVRPAGLSFAKLGLALL